MMSYVAQVVRLSDLVEEEVVLEINGMEIVCFSNSMPYGVREGNCYRVELCPQVFEDYEVEDKGCEEELSIIRDGESFSYVITGRLKDGRLNAGVVFEDNYLLSHFGYLDDRIISWRVNRIDAEFID